MKLSDEITGDLVTPPRDADDVCPLCHSWLAPGRTICDSCEKTGEAVAYPIGPPSVITLYDKPSCLRDWLTRYKGRLGDDDDPFDQSAFDRTRALLGRFLLEHGKRLANALGDLDGLVVVPSGRNRQPPHPLETLIAQLDLETPILPLLERGPGHLDFRHSAVDGYVTTGDSDKMRVLLVEDVFVTGARIFSAARALLDAGHPIAGSLVLSRRVNRDWGGCQQLWDRQATQSFSWTSSPLTAAPKPRLLQQLRGDR